MDVPVIVLDEKPGIPGICISKVPPRLVTVVDIVHHFLVVYHPHAQHVGASILCGHVRRALAQGVVLLPIDVGSVRAGGVHILLSQSPNPIPDFAVSGAKGNWT